MANKIKTIIVGAAGRDFHNFNTIYRDNPLYEVVAFTATQIPDIHDRVYPADLAGSLYPQGIPIHSEDKLFDLIREAQAEEVVFSYSDVSHQYVMHLAARVSAAGANFKLLGMERTMLRASKPVVSVCAIRTGCGKSQTTRRVAQILRQAGKRVVAVRHPMPYGDLAAQKCQRFSSLNDLREHNCTIEEMEEYEPHLQQNIIVYAGIDYQAILNAAQNEADIILWDGGNNDTPFFHSDLKIVVLDPHRSGHEISYFPGETNFISANVLVINKLDSADPLELSKLRNNIRQCNPAAMVIEAASPIFVDNYQEIAGKRVLVVEDGPTLTHGEMAYGAGVVAARKYGAAEIIDPRPYVVGSIAATFQKYPKIGPLLPAMGYGHKQIKDLQDTINRAEADLIISATPVDLTRIIKVKKLCLRVRYELQEIGTPTLQDALQPLF